MENNDNVCDKFSTINPDTLEEIEAIKVIYEGQVSSSVEGDMVNVTFADKKLLIAFILKENYPDENPEMEISYCSDGFENVLMNELKRCANENNGNPMLYTLIAKALELTPEVVESPVEEEKKQCQFFIQGNCRFGEKCFNLHGEEDPPDKDSIDNGVPSENDVPSENGVPCEDGVPCEEVSSLSFSSEQEQISLPKDGEKKKPMKTAIDVIHRILWDDAFPTEKFIVGYLDRFLGVQEKPFTAFSWEDISSVDQDVLAIPKHRIQYFKYKSDIVWNKNERLDNIFGSTGNPVTIIDIINKDIENENVNLDE